MLRVAVVAAAVLLTGCAGTSEFEKCVAHSVEEGVERERAEAGCEAAVGR